MRRSAEHICRARSDTEAAPTIKSPHIPGLARRAGTAIAAFAHPWGATARSDCAVMIPSGSRGDPDLSLSHENNPCNHAYDGQMGRSHGFRGGTAKYSRGLTGRGDPASPLLRDGSIRRWIERCMRGRPGENHVDSQRDIIIVPDAVARSAPSGGVAFIATRQASLSGCVPGLSGARSIPCALDPIRFPATRGPTQASQSGCVDVRRPGMRAQPTRCDGIRVLKNERKMEIIKSNATEAEPPYVYPTGAATGKEASR